MKKFQHQRIRVEALRFDDGPIHSRYEPDFERLDDVLEHSVNDWELVAVLRDNVGNFDLFYKRQVE